ncbi:MAG: hypothetical protein ACI9WU_002038 [Myxococcota bacterium]
MSNMHQRLGALATCLGLFIAASTASAQSGPQLVNISFAGEETKTYRGVLVKMEYWVPLPDQWELVEDGMLELTLSHTPVLIERLSSLTAEINDTAISSTFLNIQSARGTTLKWPVKPEYLKFGEMNKIVVIAKLRSDLELCDDVHSPALWLTLEGANTQLTLKYKEKPVELDISRFPQSYLRPELTFQKEGSGDDVHAVIVTPVDRTPEILRGIAIVGARLGVGSQRSGGRYLVRAVGDVDGDVREELAGRNLIVIGPTPFVKRLGLDAESLLDAAAALGRGWIVEAENPFNSGRRAMAVTGADDVEIGKAVSALQLPHLSAQWTAVEGEPARRSASFDTAPQPPASRARAQQGDTATLSLVDLGASDMTVRGKFTHFLSIAFPNPYVGRIKSPAFIRFVLSHSELLLPQTSSMLVHMNGQPVRSIRLMPGTAGRLEADVIIPAELLGERVILAEIELFLDIGDTDCHYAFPEMSWATVHNESFIAFPLTDAPTTSLRSYPWVVSKDSNMGGVGFVVSDTPSDEELSAVANMSAFLGESLPRSHDARGVPVAPWVTPVVRTVSGLTDADQSQRDLLVLGDYEMVRSNSQILASVPDGLMSEGDGDQYKNEGGWVTLGQSPWNPRRNMLIVSGAGGAAAVSHAAAQLWDAAEVDKLSGSSVLIGANGSSQVLAPAPGEESQPSPSAPNGGAGGSAHLVPNVPTAATGGASNNPSRAALQAVVDNPGIVGAGGSGISTDPISAPAQPSAKHKVAYLVFVILGLLLVILVVVRIRDAMRSNA